MVPSSSVFALGSNGGNVAWNCVRSDAGWGVLKPLCQKIALEDVVRFRRALRTWFEREGRDYPWRQTRDPYRILVSEMMLQQTQIATVLRRRFYERFLEAFPDLRSLAKAKDEVLLKAWEGLGYYRRVRMLREAARKITKEHEGVFPRKYEEILALPGVGRYTAGAVASFAFNSPTPVVDGNVARVLSRLMDFPEEIDRGPAQKQLWSWAGELVDPSHARIFNSALMEVGQTCCRPGVPDCLSCPISRFCLTSTPEDLPRKTKRAKPIEVEERAVYARDGGKVLLCRQEEGRRVGMWRLPLREVDPAWPLVYQCKYGITKYRVTLKVHRAPEGVQAGVGEVWHAVKDLQDRVIPPTDRRALAALLESDEEIS
ncbi:MAG: A/G-specific adenine glycosylase [Verrucomicrobiales bacterium]